MSDAPDIGRAVAVVLAGGRGKRLRPVVDGQPKVLARVAGEPFICHVLDKLLLAGFRRAVLCTGHLAPMVEEALGRRYKELALAYSVEQAPLDTGGALGFALDLLGSDQAMVVNGDSLIATDLMVFWAWFFKKKRRAALLLARVDDVSRYGQVGVQGEKITGFFEKKAQSGPGWVSAGVYIFQKKLLAEKIPEGSFSLEKELFPALAREGALDGFCTSAPFLDMGTPESYARAEKFLSQPRN